MKIVKFPKDPCLLLKGVSETIQNKAKEQKRAFIAMLLGTLMCKFIRTYVNR